MRFVPVLVVGASAAIVWSLFAPPEHSIPARLGKLLGSFEAEWMKAREDAAASQAEEIAAARARVERETYVTKKAADAEANVIQKQTQATSDSHWLQKWVGAPLADGICGLAVLGTMQGDKDVEKYLEFCSMGDGIRRGMAEDYADVLNDGRTTVMEDMTRAFREAQRTD